MYSIKSYVYTMNILEISYKQKLSNTSDNESKSMDGSNIVQVKVYLNKFYWLKLFLYKMFLLLGEVVIFAVYHIEHGDWFSLL